MGLSYIPKIVYNVTTLNFTYPPEVDDGEQDAPDLVAGTALAGDLQVVYNHIEVTRHITLSLLTPTQFANLQTFYRTWAALGNPFDYYESDNDASFQTYTLDVANDASFVPVRQAYSGANSGFLYQVQMIFRRAI